MTNITKLKVCLVTNVVYMCFHIKSRVFYSSETILIKFQSAIKETLGRFLKLCLDE